MSNAKPYNPTLHKARYKLKGLMLFIVPFPVLIAAIIDLLQSHPMDAIINATAFAGFMLSASIARLGFKNEGKYIERTIAKAPSTPYKTIAAIFLSVTTGLLNLWLSIGGDNSDHNLWLSIGDNIMTSILVGLTTFIGFYLYYGLDPRKDKAGNLRFGVSTEEIMQALEDAEVRIDAIDAARRHIANIDINQQLQRITDKARAILKTIEEDPKDLDRSRKFLKVYLDGAKKVTESYAKAKDIEQEVDLKTNFMNVLDSIEQTFDKQQEELKKNNHFDLDVQIEVLKTQLKQEGIK